MRNNSLKTGLCVIARMKSERLPRKALNKICGETSLIAFLLRRLKLSTYADHIILCTSNLESDNILVRTAEEELVSLVADDPLNVFSRIEKAIERFDLDLVVRITGDNPLTDPFHLDKMIEEHIAFGADYTFNKDMPIGTKGEVFKASAIQKAHRYASDPNLSEYMTFFFKDSDFFSSHEYKSGFENVSDIRLTVDFQEDFLIVKNIAENIYPGNPGFTVSDILAYLEKNPSLLEMNKNMVSPFNNPIMEKCFIQQKPRA